MRVTARFVSGGIRIRRAMSVPSQSGEHEAQTLVLSNVTMKKVIQGEMIEENEKRIQPRREIAGWPKLRFSVDHYVDQSTGVVVEKAKAVYMVGPVAYYLPE